MNKNYLILIIAIISSSLYNKSLAQEEANFSEEKDTLVFTQIIQNPEIDKINSLYKSSFEDANKLDGYKIQVFFGRNRERANKVLEEFQTEFPEIEAERIYEEPDFKIIVGKYRTKLDAEREIQDIRKKYKSAIIILSKIDF